MQLINPSNPRIKAQQPGFIGMCEHIARCAAICYDSKPKEGEEAVEFVKRLAKLGHGRALEFGTVCWTEERSFDGTFNTDGNNSWFDYEDSEDGRYRYVTSSLRYYLETNFSPTHFEYGIDFMREYWNGEANEDTYDNPIPQDWNENFVERITILYPAISRAIADEFRTHTTLSTLMQSTRYCNLTKKSDNDGIRFIKPLWYDSVLSQEDHQACVDFRHQLEEAEKEYNRLLAFTKPENARDVLPLCVATKMVQCGFLPAWKHLVELRAATAAHPQARQMADAISNLLFNPKN